MIRPTLFARFLMSYLMVLVLAWLFAVWLTS